MLPTDPMPGDYDSPDQEGERKRKAEASLREDRLRAVEAALVGSRVALGFSFSSARMGTANRNVAV
jgi:hypothetical protein